MRSGDIASGWRGDFVARRQFGTPTRPSVSATSSSRSKGLSSAIVAVLRRDVPQHVPQGLAHEDQFLRRGHVGAVGQQ